MAENSFKSEAPGTSQGLFLQGQLHIFTEIFDYLAVIHSPHRQVGMLNQTMLD